MSTHGKFVWHDLMSSDVEKSKRFYGELFNWRIWKGEHGDYEHISAGSRDIGGIVALDPKHGAPPHWIGYIASDDIQAVVALATEAGGRVYVPVTDIPHVGQFAVVADPRGAVFAPFAGIDAKHSGETEERQSDFGVFCWDELLTDDPEAELRFYSRLFGWGHEKMEMGSSGTYYLFKRGQVNAGGMMKSPPNVAAPPSWLSYVAVADADATAARTSKLGGSVIASPQDIPGVGRFAVLADDSQVVFAVLQPAR
jgi:predicted enzyme related to lactoylglutathione lyase